jgi:hypothetical protein
MSKQKAALTINYPHKIYECKHLNNDQQYWREKMSLLISFVVVSLHRRVKTEDTWKGSFSPAIYAKLL